MKKRTRTLLILLALALAIAVLPRLCATVEGAAPSGGQQTGPDLPLIDGEGAEDAQEEAADLPLIGEEDAPGQALTEPTQLPVPSAEPTSAPAEPEEAAIDEDGEYTSRDDVALYLYTYGRLPGNFITKKQAQALGWSGGGLDDYAYGKCIGGDRFGNYEGLLPERKGRQYYECDVGTLHRSSRGAKRIIFSSDGLIYYTDDHYESFTLLYGEE